MRIIALSTLTTYSKRRPDAAKALVAWYSVVTSSTWRNAADVKATYGNASIIDAERVVFNIAGNKHRLVVAINYRCAILFIKFIGNHVEYDRIDAANVQHGDHP
ncbi:MAG: type II toxin-antitoxin system HigB family toxin [Planctomycetota bacterium]